MGSNIIEAALKWAKLGVPVFPCGHNKAPLTSNGHLDASTDPEKVKAMFEFAGDGVFIGARMGAESGMFACDFDLYKPGAEQYMQYLSDKGLLNTTQTHTTLNGGIHLLYRGDGQYPNCKPSIGVEIKGEGGYIIVPPSDGYTVIERGIAYANPDLITELLRKQKQSSTSTVDTLKRSILSGTGFHDPLTQIAARRAAQGWPVEKIQRELLDTLEASAASSSNHARHSRWKAIVSDVGGELSRIVGSGNDKYNPNVLTEKAKERIPVDTRENLLGASGSLFVRRGPDGVHTEVGEGQAVPDWGNTVWPFEGSGYNSFEQRPIFEQRYVAYPLFAEKETVLIAAEPKTGKTAIALRLAIAVAYGESMGDVFKVTEQRPVLYFTLEGARAVEMRIAAELARREEEGIEKPEKDMLFVVDRPHNFGDQTLREANGAKIVLHNEMCKKVYGAELGVIVIDTLTKAMPGKDQNSVEDTSALFEIVDFLRTNDIKATVVFIHHLSKQGNVRGSTNIEAEVDVVLGVQRDKDGTVKMNVRRARSMDEDIHYRFEFISRYLGETNQGHKLHAPVVKLVMRSTDKVSDTAVGAARYAKNMDALIALGAGRHDVGSVVEKLAEVTDITPPRGKRPNYQTRAIQDALIQVFQGQINWSYGNYIMRLEKQGNYIVGLTILVAK